MHIIILGPPGAGKGTLAKRICDAFDLVHVSTGDLFRENIAENTELGQLAKTYIDKGDLVPDTVTVAMVRDRLSQLAAAGQGFMLDGFPRNLAQAEHLEAMFKDLDIHLDAAINVSLSEALIIARLSGRRVCRTCGASFNVDYLPPKIEGICDRCGGALYQRKDDQPDTIHNRLRTYQALTKPLIDHYSEQGILIDVENSGSAAETEAFVRQALERSVRA